MSGQPLNLVRNILMSNAVCHTSICKISRKVPGLAKWLYSSTYTAQSLLPTRVTFCVCRSIDDRYMPTYRNTLQCNPGS